MLFDKQVEQKISMIACDGYTDYYVLTHKVNRREIYLKVGDKRAIEFVKSKFKGWKKQSLYKGLQLGVLQPFLPKIKLPYKFDVILVANQMKGISFTDNKVCSFPITYNDNQFCAEKDVQLALSQNGFAPKIKLTRDPVYSVEDLCTPYDGPLEPVIDKLIQFYKRYEADGLIHGDFSIEQVVEKDGEILFIDWSVRKGSPLEDIQNMFRFQEGYEDTAEYKMIMKKLLLNSLS